MGFLLLLLVYGLTVAASRVRAEDDLQTAAVERDAALARELRELDAQIAALEQQRAESPLGGPLALASLGYLGAVGLGTLTVLTAAVGRNDAMHYATVVLPLGLGTLAALTAGTVGAVWATRRARTLPPRRRTQLRTLRSRRDHILELAPQLGPTSFGMRLVLSL